MKTGSDLSSSPAGPSPLGRPFWRLWTSSGVSNLADGVFKVALPLVAIQFTQSPTLIAGLTFALTLPWLFFALPAGAIADRLDRRLIMLGANLARVVLPTALVLAVVFDIGSIWLLYAVAFGIGVAETLYDTSAQSILPQLVDRPQLSRANGRLYAVELTANQFIGPPLGGVLVALGAVLAFGAPAALWLLAVVVLLLVRGPFRVVREGPRTTMRTDIAEGLRFLWRHRILRTLAIMTGVFNLASSGAGALFVLFAVGAGSPMGLSEVTFGLLLTTIAGGALLGSFISAWAERTIGRSRSLALTVIGCAVFIGAPAVTTNPFAMGAVFFVGGVLMVIWNVIAVSLRQRITPDRLLGRVNSGYRLVAWGTMPLGAALGGVLAQWVGLQAMFAILGILTLGLLAMMPILTDKALDQAEQAFA